MSISNQKRKVHNLICDVIFYLVVSIIVIVVIVDSRTSSLEERIEERIYDSKLAEYEDALHEIEIYKNDLLAYNKYIIEKYYLNNSGALNVEIKIFQEKINTDSIGGDIRYTYTINGKEISNQSWVTINILKPIKIDTEIREDDPSYDDVGSAGFEEIITINNLAKGVKVTQYIDVRESRGPSAGNVAKYRVTYLLKLAKPLEISAIDLDKVPSQPPTPIKPEADDVDLTYWQTICKDTICKVVLAIGLCAFLFLSARSIYFFRKERKRFLKDVQMEEKKKYEPKKEDDVFLTSVYHLPQITEEDLKADYSILEKTLASRTPEEWARIGTEHRHQRRKKENDTPPEIQSTSMSLDDIKEMAVAHIAEEILKSKIALYSQEEAYEVARALLIGLQENEDVAVKQLLNLSFAASTDTESYFKLCFAAELFESNGGIAAQKVDELCDKWMDDFLGDTAPNHDAGRRRFQREEDKLRRREREQNK